ncbi:MAG TPA: hypothetical protein VF665_17105 [Longimicrobium sp.]|jgi:hypothetical protein|uniref:hypothetical protein n=1 Tax=Longimicrobium sp. TaxID=2029185 RepID=UPI002ED98433
MRKMLVLLALCTAACGNGKNVREGEPPSTGQPDPVVSDTAKQDNTGPNGPKTGG